MKMHIQLRRKNASHSSSGIALITVLLLLLVVSALAVALMYSVNTEQHLQVTDRGQGVAYYGAEAGMEKMMSDLAALYLNFTSPTPVQIQNVACPPNIACPQSPPAGTLNGTVFDDYSILVPLIPPGQPGAGGPAYNPVTISQGPNQGLLADVLPLQLSVTARQAGGEGEDVHLIRNVEVALIPVFQFGVFSQSDLSFFAGPEFHISGRVQTNGNLFPAEGNGANLIFQSPVRAALDVDRDEMANGVPIGVGGDTHGGNVLIPSATGGCAGLAAGPSCLALNFAPAATATDQGSSWNGTIQPAGIPTAGGVANPGWTGISKTTYNGFILSGGTGATPLNLPFAPGTNPIEIIRRPLLNPATGLSLDTTLTGSSRLFNKAQLRVLLDDSCLNIANAVNAGQPGETAGCADPNMVSLVNNPPVGVQPCTPLVVPVNTTGLPAGPVVAQLQCFAAMSTAVGVNAEDICNWTQNGYVTTPVTAYPPAKSLLGGYIFIDYRNAAGLYTPVTLNILAQGFARQGDYTVAPAAPPCAAGGGTANPTPLPDSEHGVRNTVNPNAIIILQKLRDGKVTPSAPTVNGVIDDWYPINMYETREGNFRDIDNGNVYLNGVMNLVDIDVRNLQIWLAANPLVENQTQNGYILYFSDRRGMRPTQTAETFPVPPPNPPLTIAAGSIFGEYGFEDTINEGDPNGTPNGTNGGVPDQGEDVNNDGVLETYGAQNLGWGFMPVGTASSPAFPGLGTPMDLVNAPNSSPVKVIPANIARANWVSGARHGVRLINGSLGNLPNRPAPLGDPNNTGGFTLASENPAYVLGNYNANDAGFGNPHASSAVIADTVTLLSNEPNPLRGGGAAIQNLGWTDLNSFLNPTTRANRKPFGPVFYRVAIATGKNINFSYAAVVNKPAFLSGDDYGTDGGVHNFLRYLQDWGGTVNYTGSMVSLYYSAYATGVFKCCGSVYGAPTRNYLFDLDFQNLNEMPPGTPRFEDVINVGFRQDFSNR